MKKIISIISLLLVLTMIMATPTFAAESTGAAALDFTLDAANGLGIIKVPTAAKTPDVTDGKIQDGEYAYEYKVEADPIPVNSSWSSVMESYTAPVNAAVAKECISKGLLDMEKLVKDCDMTYYFAQDADNFYIGVKYDSGVIYETDAAGAIVTENFDGQTIKKAKYVLTRYALKYRIGFNLDDVDEYIQIETNGHTGDLLSHSGVKVTVLGTDIKSEGVFSSAVATVYSNEAGYSDHSYSSVTAANVDLNSSDYTGSRPDNPAMDHTVHCEFVINKAALMTFMDSYSSAGISELSNALYFTTMINPQITGVLADGTSRGWVSDGGAGYYQFSGTQKEYDLSMNAVFPDLVVFTDTTAAVGAADVKWVKAAETTETTTAATEATTTDKPADTAGSEAASTADTAAATSGADTTKADGGCGSTVTLSGIALVAAIGACAVVSEKKRRK